MEMLFQTKRSLHPRSRNQSRETSLLSPTDSSRVHLETNEHTASQDAAREEHLEWGIYQSLLGVENSNMLCETFKQQFPFGRIVFIHSPRMHPVICTADQVVSADDPDQMIGTVFGVPYLIRGSRRSIQTKLSGRGR